MPAPATRSLPVTFVLWWTRKKLAIILEKRDSSSPPAAWYISAGDLWQRNLPEQYQIPLPRFAENAIIMRDTIALRKHGFLMTLAVEVAGKTDPGRVRPNNEDNFGYDSRCGIFVVCDGMGGQAAGEVASKMGVDILLDYFRKLGSAPKNPPVNGQQTSGAESLAS